MMTIQQLTDFADINHSGFIKTRMFREGDRTCITDGAIMLRVEMEYGGTEDPEWAKKFKSVMDIRRSECTSSLPDVELRMMDVGCRECDGGGKTQMDCPDCDGSGESECPECGHLDDCETCDGTGAIDGNEDCERCDGKGELTVPAPVGIEKGWMMSGYYFSRLKSLPNLKYVIQDNIMFFQFDGGDGAVMRTVQGANQ